MSSSHILPPRSAHGDDDFSLVELAAITTSLRPGPAVRDDDSDALVNLTRWDPTVPSGFPQAWTAPPRESGRGARLALIGGVAVAFVAVGAVAFVLGARTRDADQTQTSARLEVRAAAAATNPIAPSVVRTAAAVALPPTPLAASLPTPVAFVPAPLANAVMPAAAPRAAVVEVQAASAPRARAAALPSSESGPATITAPSHEPVAVADAQAGDVPEEAATEEAAPSAPVVLAPDPALPEVPEREAVIASIDAVRPDVQACAATRHGPASVLITVGSNGRVRNAVVSGAFAGSPEGSCMARAIRAARFPAFAQPTFELSYPFAL